MAISQNWKKQKARYLTHFEFNQPQLPYLGFLGVIGYPLVYAIFTWLLPQPYESLTLRLIASLCFLPLLLINQLPGSLKRWMPLYLFLCLFIWVGSYFSYMLNMNTATPAWSASIMFGAVIMLVFMDWLSAVVLVFGSSLLGFLIYALSTRQLIPAFDVLSVYSVLAFTISAWALLSVRADKITVSKRQNMLAIGGKIVHDLQTPLATVQMSVKHLQNTLPELVDNYTRYVPQEQQSQRISKQAGLLKNLPNTIHTDLSKISLTSHMLLKSLSAERIDTSEFTTLSVKNELEQFMQSYPLHESEANTIDIEVDDDFTLPGVSALFQTVIYNLVNNALYATAGVAEPHISIRSYSAGNMNCLLIKDNGIGIPEENMPYIFNEFFTSKGAGKGSGLGLFATRKIIEASGGFITCESISCKVNPAKQGTRFTLCFPKPGE